MAAMPRPRTSASLLPAVASAPALTLQRSQSTQQTRRFGRHGSAGSDPLTPRTLERAEARMNAYLAERRASSGSNGSGPGAGRGSGSAAEVPSELSQEALKALLATPAKPLPIAPSPTPVEEQLQHLSEAAAADVLRQVPACSTLSADDLLHLLVPSPLI